MKKIERGNNVFIATCIMLVVCFAILSIGIIQTTANFTTSVAFADATTEEEIDFNALCEGITANTTITVNGESKDITNYEKYIDDEFKPRIEHSKLLIDEWILEIVPKEFFDYQVENFLYIGRSYGFFFNYDKKYGRYLIYLMLHNYDTSKSGHITRTITPLYYEEYVYYKELGKATLFHETKEYELSYGDNYYGYIYYKYSDSNNIYLKDVAFTGSLYNIDSRNFGEEGYNASQDNGGYFIGGDYVFNGVSPQSGIFASEA